MTGRAICIGIVLMCSVVHLMCSVVHGADWYVVPAQYTGDGTQAKPFNDPWRALAAASPGDTIHIAQGVYYGRHDRSSWTIDRPRVTLLGGYDREFKTRNPWKQPSVFAFFAEYEGVNENYLLAGMNDHSGIVIDGLAFDGAGRNRYDAKAPFALLGGMSQVQQLVSFSSSDVVIRNSLFINSRSGAVDLRGEGALFENNIVMNMQGFAALQLREGTTAAKKPAVIKNNTFAFCFDESDPPMGKGGDKGIAIRVATGAQIEKNFFVACGNAGISLAAKPDRVSLDGNVFWLMMRGNIVARDGVRELLITDKNMEELEDIGFKSAKDNKAADANLSGLPAEWIDGVTKNLALAYAKPPKENIAAVRKKFSLDEEITRSGDNDFGPAAPRIDAPTAAALRVQGDAGAREVELKVQAAAGTGATPAASYTHVEWAELNSGAQSLDGKPIEVRVGIGNERHGFVLKDITQEKYLGFDVYHPGGDKGPDQIHVFAVRHGPAHRQWQESSKSNNAREIEDWYLIRGTCRLTGQRQKATIQVDSIAATKPPARKMADRPKGKDWYIRAGATDGDGTKEKPFRDPFQALEKASPGDHLHVASGDYFGKLKSGNWKLNAAQLTMLGGYDADFRARDPWKNPTRLVLPPDLERKDKANHTGKFLESGEITHGFVLDGFVFDGSTFNNYFDAASGGGLDVRSTPLSSMIQLRGADMTIRNCVFANASGIAVELSGIAGVFENNVIVNTSGIALAINANGPGPWQIRRNTILFALDPTPRAGSGASGAAGNILFLRGRAAATIEGNIFAFAENRAVHVTTPGYKLALDGNTLAANLALQLTDSKYIWLHDSVWQRRIADTTFISARDNNLTLPANIAFDQEYLDKALPRLFELKCKLNREDWVKIAAATGSKVTPPPAEPTRAPVDVEKPKVEKKEQSLDDLMAELNKLKQDSAKPVETKTAPKGPPYAPAYSWKKALELPSDDAKFGAQRQLAR
jgi:hypothetical protein